MNRRVPGRHATQLRLAPLLPILALSACASVLGIEDIKQDPGLPNGGTTTTTTDSQGGDKNVGGSQAGSANNGGTSNVAGNEATGGSPPLAGATSAGEGGMGGTPDPGDPTVHGKVIDFWGTPVPNMPLMVGDTLTNTDEDGEFVVEEVANTYDVELAFDIPYNGNPRAKAYLFHGLTRRDPTIQLRQAFDIRSARAVVTPANVTLATGDIIKIAVGGDTGNVSTSMQANGLEFSCNWEGSETTQQTAHALHLSLDDDTDLPTAYKSFDSSLVALAETGKSQVSLDLTPKTVVTGTLQGTATTGGGTDRENWVYLRFDTGAVMQLINDSSGSNSFSYLLPVLPSSSITVAASEGWEEVEGPFAITYKTGLSADAKPALKIPTPATLVSPGDGADGVDAETKFRFTSPASNSGPFVIHFENVNVPGPFQDLYVITAEKELTIPDVLDGGFELNPGDAIRWNVETHGAFDSVDAMAGPDGFLDLFAWENGPVGPLTDDGEWTNSAPRYFTTAP
jgi:hypothetical protein